MFVSLTKGIKSVDTTFVGGCRFAAFEVQVPLAKRTFQLPNLKLPSRLIKATKFEGNVESVNPTIINHVQQSASSIFVVPPSIETNFLHSWLT